MNELNEPTRDDYKFTKKIPIKAYDKKPRVTLTCEEPTLTKQSFKDECDINQILAKYQKTGAIAHANNHAPQYGFATSQSFTEAMFLVKKAQGMFDDLPSSIRAKFNNDPAQFLEFTTNPDNEEEMAELGLIPSSPNQPKGNNQETSEVKTEVKTEVKASE